jgi:membrane-associated protein
MSEFIDFFLHAEKHLEWFIKTYNLWIYALLFAIIFCETGLIVTPFLPGDSLLFAVGALAGKGLIDWKIITPLLLLAAILGDGVNYAIGKWVGPKVFHFESSRFLNKAHLMKAHAFYEKHGPITIVIGRFLPFIRTFAPFVAGVAQMRYPVFVFYNIIGGIIWVCSLTALGYMIGDHPWVKSNFSLVALAMIIIPGLPALWIFLKELLARFRK